LKDKLSQQVGQYRTAALAVCTSQQKIYDQQHVLSVVLHHEREGEDGIVEGVPIPFILMVHVFVVSLLAGAGAENAS
jgi:hypothetical protein